MNEATQAVCPVMGQITDKSKAEEQGLIRKYNGKTYYLCCAGCGPAFDQNPEQYTSSDS